MNKISIFAIFLYFLSIGNINGQVTSNELVGTWRYSTSGGHYSYTYRYTFNQDGTGVDYSEIHSFGSLPSGYVKTTTKFKWVIINGKVYGTAISMSSEEYKDGKIKFDSVDMRPIAEKKDMNLTFTTYNRQKCISTSGLYVSHGVFLCR